MTKIALPHCEVKKGSALTIAEERKPVNWCISHKDSSAASALLVLLYTGMRVGVRTSAVDRGYTTYSMEYMLIEIEKIDNDFKDKKQRKGQTYRVPAKILLAKDLWEEEPQRSKVAARKIARLKA